ncbi:MAG: ribonucleoside-diphosphate reductase, adenosylcobalamin-dependent, partial [Methermicoccaceae archaeon]
GVMGFIQRVARDESVSLGEERGDFPAFQESIWADKFDHMRNATVTTIAPTGSISIIAGCSSGIEPLFGVAYVREALEGELLIYEDEHFVNVAKNLGFYSNEVMQKVARAHSLSEVKEIPEEVSELFKCAMDLTPEQHVMMQAAFQRHVDNAVSKTVNLRESASPADVKRVYELAWRLNCKGITVFRYRSRDHQVLRIAGDVIKINGGLNITRTCPNCQPTYE